ncbi:ECF transporter S component [Candidatus Oleimmundimicrobium sp.]|uniref:YybS family protein n=1 Tax=Candidatus Oleimmundimicrobium sp. TaxID=3060597 RepID=UPI0027292D5A|nr:ECF transporter S component [Candidatus Oleimmundimicrobium sp.]MDO8885600.1 DUF2232 domain-containing protein [Candidatus Oleimmundimicrobium sp.]
MDENRVNTRALVEAGKLSALTLVFAFLSLVLPVFSFVTIPLCAVPTVIVSVRYGFKYGFLTAITASFLVAVFMEPSSAVPLFLIILFLGLSQGISIRRNYSVWGVILAGLVGVVVTIALMALITYFLSGVNLFYEQIKLFKESIVMQEQLGLRYGLGKEEIVRQQHLLNQMAENFSKVIPAIIVIVSGWISAFCCFITYQILKRLKLKLPKIISFKMLQVPWFFSWGYLLGLAALFFYKWFGNYSGTVSIIGMNLLLIFGVIFLIQGSAIIFYFFEKYKLSLPVKILFFFLALFIQIMFQGLTWLGLFDTWFNYRKVPQEAY